MARVRLETGRLSVTLGDVLIATAAGCVVGLVVGLVVSWAVKR